MLKMSISLGTRSGAEGMAAAIKAEQLIEAAFTAARKIEGVGFTYEVSIWRDYAREDSPPIESGKDRYMAAPMTRDDVERIVQAVAELPDRTSPDDWPDAMLVTADELRAILADALTPPADPVGASPEEIEQLVIIFVDNAMYAPGSLVFLPQEQARAINAALRGYAALLRQQAALDEAFAQIMQPATPEPESDDNAPDAPRRSYKFPKVKP